MHYSSLRSILEEGLKKGSPQISHQNKYLNDRYNDKRKERKIKEAKKIVDLKKVIVCFVMYAIV